MDRGSPMTETFPTPFDHYRGYGNIVQVHRLKFCLHIQPLQKVDHLDARQKVRERLANIYLDRLHVRRSFAMGRDVATSS